jgi:hypothetical protein
MGYEPWAMGCELWAMGYEGLALKGRSFSCAVRH